jgi:hypothetical protein
MSKETPQDDPRQQTDWKNTKQTDEHWKGQSRRSRSPVALRQIWKNGTKPTRTEPVDCSIQWRTTSVKRKRP